MHAPRKSRPLTARATGAALLGAGALLLTGCATVGSGTAVPRRQATLAASAGERHMEVVGDLSGPTTGATQASIANDLAIAEQRYQAEINGARVHRELQWVADDSHLMELLARGRYAAAQSVAYRLMVGDRTRHVTRIAFVRGGREVIDAVWNANGSFVAAPQEHSVTVDGRVAGTLLVSIQDIAGYVKLIPRYTPAQALVRGASGQLRTSLPAAAGVTLPDSGEVAIAGTSYLVRSFRTYAWGRGPGREPLTVWVLQAL